MAVQVSERTHHGSEKPESGVFGEQAHLGDLFFADSTADARRIVMAYPGYGGGVSPGRFGAASTPGCEAPAGGGRVHPLSVLAYFCFWYSAAPGLCAV